MNFKHLFVIPLCAGLLCGCTVPVEEPSISDNSTSQSPDNAKSLERTKSDSQPDSTGGSNTDEASETIPPFEFDSSLAEQLGTLDSVGDFTITPPMNYERRTPNRRTRGSNWSNGEGNAEPMARRR